MGYIGAAYLVAIDDPITEITSMTNAALKLGRDSQNLIDFATTDDVIILRAANANQIQIQDGVIRPVTTNDIDLGSATYEFKNAWFDGTVTADAFAGPLTGNVTGTADVATVATTVTITDNESTNEDNAIIFTSGGDVDGGNIGLESDGTLTYNPSTGTVTATTFAGALTGNASGTAATVTAGAQSAITSLGTLTTLTVDNVIINGTTIGHTSDTDLITIADGAVTIAGTIGSGAITSTAGLTGTQVDILAQGDLRLQDSSGGQYIALQAHATTTSYTLTFPAAVAASAGQYLSSATDGTLSWATPSGGKVGQVIQAVKTDAFTGTTTDGSFEAVSGWTVNITPAASSSKVLITVSGFVGNTVGGQSSYFQLFRDSTAIGIGDASGNRDRASFAHGGTQGWATGQVSFTYLDSPSTTSQVTYSVKAASQSAHATAKVTVGIRGDDTDAANKVTVATTIIVQEILA